jgi:hypothetical protein
MSMFASFRQISPQMLIRIKAQPALVGDIIYYRPAGNVPASDGEIVASLMPLHMRKAIEQMPQETRAEFYAGIGDLLESEQLPDEFKQRVGSLRQSPSSRSTTIDPIDLGEELDIAKAWHGIHFLLCGVAGNAPGPLGNAILGGNEIGADRGYGPARYLEAAEAWAVAAALELIETTEIASRYDAAALGRERIYPGSWSDDPDTISWLCDVYAELRAFYIDAARRGFGVLLYLS